MKGAGNMVRKHRVTGNPRGRPRRIPETFGEQILEVLRRRIDSETGLVQPHWKQLARELGVSHSTLARHIFRLRTRGRLESIGGPRNPKSSIVFYRLP